MRLHDQVKHQERIIKAYSEALREFRCHLALPKFQGVGRDYIQTGDVLRWIEYIENAEVNATNAEYVCEGICDQAICRHPCENTGRG